MASREVAELVRTARAQAGMTQRELAQKARTTQSVVARIERNETSPSWTTLTRILAAAGFRVSLKLERIPTLDPSELDDIPRILRLTPEERLLEVARASRFVTASR